jgi:hypothetical protein
MWTHIIRSFRLFQLLVWTNKLTVAIVFNRKYSMAVMITASVVFRRCKQSTSAVNLTSDREIIQEFRNRTLILNALAWVPLIQPTVSAMAEWIKNKKNKSIILIKRKHYNFQSLSTIELFIYLSMKKKKNIYLV